MNPIFDFHVLRFLCSMKKEIAKKRPPKVEKVRNQLVVGSNDLIEAKYNFSLWQKRVFVYMVSQIGKNDAEFLLQRIYIKDLMLFFDVKSRDDYNTILRVPESLFNARLHLPYLSEDGFKRWRNTRIISTYTEPGERDERNSYIELQFNGDLKAHLLELHEAFTKYDIRNIIALRSVYSFRMYELLKSRSYRADLLTIDVDDLKETLDVETKYKNYADFKRFVLLQGQKDLTKSCDISYTFDEIKEGKKVKTLTFKVFENRPDKAKKDGEIMVKKAVGAATQGGLFGEIYPQVEAWGVGSEVLQLLIETQPEDALRNGLAYTKWALEEGKIKENTAGFFITAVKNKYTTPQYENAKRRAELVREAKKREVEIKQLEVMLADMRDDFQTARNDAVRDVVDAHPDATNRAVEVVKTQNQTYFELKQMNIDHLTLADFREDKILRGLVIQEIEAQNPTFFTEINARFPDQIKNLERKIKALKRG